MRAQESHAGWEFLLVGGDAGLYKTLTAAIHAFSSGVTTTSNVDTALHLLGRRKLEGVFVDMRLKGAMELLYTLRRGGSNRNAVVIACAQSGDEANPVLRTVANYVLGTPLAAYEVKEILAACLPLIAAERVRYERFQVSLPVLLEIDNQRRSAVTANVSRGGMAIRCDGGASPGSPVHFVLELPAQEPIKGLGEVAWSKGDGEMGIKFHLPNEDARKTLWNWMARSGRASAPSSGPEFLTGNWE